MSSEQIVSVSNYSAASDISYAKAKINPSGGKNIAIMNGKVRKNTMLSTPLMLTWCMSEFNDDKTGKRSFELSLQFPNAEYPNADCDAFLDSLRKLESKIKSDALTYSKEWFGKTITSSDVMDEKFNIMLRHPKKEKGSAELDYNKPPTLTVKSPCWKGVWQSEIYDEEGEPLFIKGKSAQHLSPLDFLKPKTHVICLIQCGGLWFVNGKVSITWNLKQAIVQKPKSSYITEGTCFLRIKPAEKELLKTLPPPEDDIDPDGITSTIVDDSDDEREVPVPVPVVPVVEQVVVKDEVPQEEPKKKRVISKKTKIEA